MKNLIASIAVILLLIVTACTASAQSGIYLAPGETLIAVDGVLMANCSNGRCGLVQQTAINRQSRQDARVERGMLFPNRPVFNTRVTRTRVFWVR